MPMSTTYVTEFQQHPFFFFHFKLVNTTIGKAPMEYIGQAEPSVKHTGRPTHGTRADPS